MKRILYILLFISVACFGQIGNNVNTLQVNGKLFYIEKCGVEATATSINKSQAIVFVNRGNAPYTYYWTNGSTNDTASNISIDTTNYVTVTDAYGCTGTAEMQYMIDTTDQLIWLYSNINNVDYSVSAPDTLIDEWYDYFDRDTAFQLTGADRPKYEQDSGLYFDQAGDYLTLKSFYPKTDDSFSVEIWFNPITSPSDMTLIDNRDGSGDGWRILYNSANETIIVQYGFTQGSYNSNATPVNNWSHLIITYDVTGNMTGYVNDTIDNYSSLPADISGESNSVTTAAKIGARSFSTPAVFYGGWIYQITIYDKILTSDERTALYHQYLKTLGL